MSDETHMKRCVCCARPAGLVCARCNDNYCSIDCQRADWQLHRQICFKMPNLVPDVDILEKKLNSTLVVSKRSTEIKQVTSPSTVYGSLEDLEEASKVNSPDKETAKASRKISHKEVPQPLINATEDQQVKAKAKEDPDVQQTIPKPKLAVNKEETIPEPEKVVPNKAIPFVMKRNPLKFAIAEEPKKAESPKPITFLSLNFRVWPESRNVKVKILGMLEFNVFTLREDNEDIDGYFEMIDEEVTKYCRSQPKLDSYDAMKGEMVLALFEGEWYRAHVLDVNVDGVIVQYIDYGNLAVVKQGELMPAPQHLMFDVCTRDFVIDNMPEQLDEKQIEIIQSAAVIITNIHRVDAIEFHCSIFGF